jgi:hypothetical protein
LLTHAQEERSRPAATDDLVTNEAQAAINRGLEYLASAQSTDGAYSDRSGFGNVAVSALAGLALLAGGHQPGKGRHGRAVSRCVDYVLARGNGARAGYLQNADQFLSHSAMYQHGFGALFLSEVCGTLPDPARQVKVRDMLEKSVALIVKSQNREGGWRYEPQPNNADVSVTVAQLMALRAAKNAGVFIDKSVIDKCVEYIKGCKLADGGFCYQKGQPATGSLFPRSAAAVVGLFSAGIYEGDDHRKYVEPGLKYLMRFRPQGGARIGVDVRQDHYFYGHYYAALAMWTAGGNYWSDWFPAIRNELLVRRNNASTWDDFHGAAYATAMACIILQLPNNYLPIMQK